MRKLAIGVSIAALVAVGGAQAQDQSAADFQAGFIAGKVDWSAVSERAKTEAKVNLYYWGGSDPLNVWMDSVVTPAMAELGVTLNPVRITGTKDAVDLVLAELGSGKKVGEGSVDAIWLNGENFSTLKKQDALFGAFAPLLPNAKNIEWNESDPRSLLNLRDFGVTTGGAEMPWSGEQYVCAVNADRVTADQVPHNFDDLQTYLTANPGKFIYVKPPHYLGNTFVQETIYAHNPDGTGAAPFQQSIDELGAAELARLITPGLEYLKAVEPLLLGGQGGAPRYPEDGAALDGMFLNGEVNFDCKFGLYAVATGLTQGTYPAAAQEFIFPEGNMIKNKNYIAIPANAPNPAAALVLADYMTTVPAQISKLQMTGMPAGIDPWLLSAEDAEALAAASPGHTGVTGADLDANIAPDTNATLVDVIEATWLDYIERDSTDSIETIVTRAVANLSK